MAIKAKCVHGTPFGVRCFECRDCPHGYWHGVGCEECEGYHPESGYERDQRLREEAAAADGVSREELAEADREWIEGPTGIAWKSARMA